MGFNPLPPTAWEKKEERALGGLGLALCPSPAVDWFPGPRMPVSSEVSGTFISPQGSFLLWAGSDLVAAGPPGACAGRDQVNPQKGLGCLGMGWEQGAGHLEMEHPTGTSGTQLISAGSKHLEG